MKCIHHNDMDGRAAARVVADFENNYNQDDYFEMDYADDVPYDKISNNERVYIVDYSFTVNNREKLDKILKITDDVIWIDHHKSSIKLIDEYPEYKKIKGIIKEGISGAALSYMFLHKVQFSEIPMYLAYVSDYDCWVYKYGVMTKYFKCYMDSVDTTPFSEVWDMLSKDDSNDYLAGIMKQGSTIYRYIQNNYKELRERLAYELDIEGHKALVINSEGNSWLFGNDIKRYDICVAWNYNGNTYNYSLYADQEKESPIDVSKIAEKFGGGGHPGASGVQSKDRIW